MSIVKTKLQKVTKLTKILNPNKKKSTEKFYKNLFQTLLNLVKNQKKELGRALMKLTQKIKNKQAGNITTLINKRLQQINDVSKYKFIKDVCIVEYAVWKVISSSTESVGFYKEGLNNVLTFYGKTIDALKNIVTIKSKEAESLEIKDDEKEDLSKSFAEMFKSLRNICDSHNNNYLRQTVQNADAEIVDFLNAGIHESLGYKLVAVGHN